MRQASGSSPAGPTTDAFAVNESASILTPDTDNYLGNWPGPVVVDNACLYNGYNPSDGTQGAFTTWRFSLGPFGSLHEFVFVFRRGPDHGDMNVYLASIPEDDPASGDADPTNILTDISTLSWVLAFSLGGYAAALTPNVSITTGWHVDPLRVMGAPGAPLTGAVQNPHLGYWAIDGGPGPYAMMVAVESKGGPSTGYKCDLQDIHRKRIDWAWG